MALPRIRTAALLSTLTVLASCSTLSVSEFNNDATKVSTGIAYALPFTQYKISVTRRIVNCQEKGPEFDAANNRINPRATFPNVKLLVKAEISPELVDDGHHVYTIDTASLAGLTKVSNLSIEFKDGRLTAINASADDQTGEIITQLAQGFGKIALSAINPALVGVAAAADDEPPVPVVFCKPEIITAVENAALLEKQIKALTAQITELSETIGQYRSDLATIGGRSRLDCTRAGNAATTQCLLDAAVAASRASQTQLASRSKELGVQLEIISETQVFRWPETSDITASARALTIRPSTLNEWFSQGSVKETQPVPEHQRSIANLASEYSVLFGIGRIGSYGVDVPGAYGDDLGPEGGIRYRMPAMGYLAVCQEVACTRDDAALIASHVGPVQQLGHILSVPFESVPFSNRSLALTFDDFGRPKTAEFKSTEAPLQNAAVAANAFIDQYVAARAAEAADTNTPLENLQEQTALLTAQKELQDAQNALAGNPALKDLQDLTEIAKAEKAYADALAALNVEDQPPSAVEQELSIINAETTLLKARAANLDAQRTVRLYEQALQRL